MTRENIKNILTSNERRNTRFEQFRTMNCYTSQTMFVDGCYVWLVKSYSTIVGIYDIDTDTMYEINKWSVTTSKQVTTVCRDYRIKNRVLIKDNTLTRYQ